MTGLTRLLVAAAFAATAVAMAMWLVVAGLAVATVTALASPTASPAATQTVRPAATFTPTAMIGATPAPVTATVAAGAGGVPTLQPAVDWPKLPDLSARSPYTTTAHFRVFAEDPADPTLLRTAERWSPRLEDILATVSARMGRTLPRVPVDLVFARAYAAPCPARGLAAPGEQTPLLMIYVNEATGAVQLNAVLAHEMVHHLTFDDRFVGDGILTEGIAHWGAGQAVLTWQGLASWDAAVRAYIAEGRYVSIADDTGLNPRPGDDCLERRDRVYNIRTAFVDWLVRRVGLGTVLAMPFQEHETVDAKTGETSSDKTPDYVAATGHSLRELEQIWLAELTRGGGGDA